MARIDIDLIDVYSEADVSEIERLVDVMRADGVLEDGGEQQAINAGPHHDDNQHTGPVAFCADPYCRLDGARVYL